MFLETRNFGRIELPEDKIITFKNGLVAFAGMTRYSIIEHEDKDIPLAWLQSAEDPELAFTVINPFLVRPDYEFELSPAERAELKIKKTEDVAVLTIVVVPEDIRKMTTNLLAPLVINV